MSSLHGRRNTNCRLTNVATGMANRSMLRTGREHRPDGRIVQHGGALRADDPCLDDHVSPVLCQGSAARCSDTLVCIAEELGRSGMDLGLESPAARERRRGADRWRRSHQSSVGSGLGSRELDMPMSAS